MITVIYVRTYVCMYLCMYVRIHARLCMFALCRISEIMKKMKARKEIIVKHRKLIFTTAKSNLHLVNFIMHLIEQFA
jgi:hypothetical protein